MAEGKRLYSQLKMATNKIAVVQLYLRKNLKFLVVGHIGTVCKAKCDEIMCAAKKIYPALFQVEPIEPGREHTHPLRRFEAECYLLKSIHHPNIVQYLGTYRDPDTNAPVLLMELMDQSLTHFLESSPGDIPYHIQVNLSYDIAQALAFLHSNGIIHRDLSSNNVLILVGSRANITDFGMSKLIDTNIQMTKCPGTPAFMPPEALDEPPAYTEKIDTFSFGVLVTQILTRQFPNPTNRFKVMPDLINPNNPSLSLRAPVAEVQRRYAHINLINSTQPLLPIALNCLDSKEADRPTAQRLCIVLDLLKDTPMHQESCQQHTDQVIRAKDAIIRVNNEQIRITHEDLVSKIQQLLEKEEKLNNQRYQLEAKETEIRKLTHELQDATREIDDRTKQLRETNKQLQDTEQIITQLNKIATKDIETEQNSTDFKQQTNPAQILETEPELQEIKVSIEGSTRIPCATKFDQIAIVDNKAYFKAPDNVILEYSTTSTKWSKIKGPLSGGFSIVSVDNILTTVGENGLFSYSNKLYCYQNEKWVEKFPTMKSERRFPAVVYAQINLVVIGGNNIDKTKANNIDQYVSQGEIEVLNTQTSQWSVVYTRLLQPLYMTIISTYKQLRSISLKQA